MSGHSVTTILASLVLYVVVVSGIPADYCNNTVKTCYSYANADSSLELLVSAVKVSGWTFLVDPCHRICSGSGCRNPNLLSCTPVSVQQPSVPLVTSGSIVRSMIDNVRVMWESANPSFTSEYPCALFYVGAENITIEDFSFEMTDCVTSVMQMRALNDQPSSDAWLLATPIVGIADSLAGMHLYNLVLTGGGDAVARLLPLNDVISMDGSQFYNVSGLYNISSPIRTNDNKTFDVIIGSATGQIAAINTNVAAFGGSQLNGATLLGSWLGAPVSYPCSIPVPPHVDPAHCSQRVATPSITVALLAVFLPVMVAIALYCLKYLYDEISELKPQKKP